MCTRRENLRVPMTMPLVPAGTSSESFFTSSPARPKIACSSFSSGVSSVLLLGLTLPTRMSPGPTRAPTRMMPLSSRLRSMRSETLGMSRVNSSRPSLVSRTSTSNESMCTLVNASSLTRRSEMTMASSKLYPSKVLKAISALCPMASSPCIVDAPSAMTWPLATFWPGLTMGFWFWQVRSLRPTNLRSTYSSALSMMIRCESTKVTVPARLALISMPE